MYQHSPGDHTSTTSYLGVGEFLGQDYAKFEWESNGECLYEYDIVGEDLIIVGEVNCTTGEPQVFQIPSVTIDRPLWMGKTWEMSYHDDGEERLATVEVEGVEAITVPAGTFQCFRIRVSWRPEGNPLWYSIYWWSEDIQSFVRDEDYGGGSLSDYSVLISHVRP